MHKYLKETLYAKELIVMKSECKKAFQYDKGKAFSLKRIFRNRNLLLVDILIVAVSYFVTISIPTMPYRATDAKVVVKGVGYKIIDY